jgi:hypothetical protein
METTTQRLLGTGLTEGTDLVQLRNAVSVDETASRILVRTVLAFATEYPPLGLLFLLRRMTTAGLLGSHFLRQRDPDTRRQTRRIGTNSSTSLGGDIPSTTVEPLHQAGPIRI